MNQNEVNLQILSNPKSSRYMNELKRSPNIVAQHQLQKYYTILIRSINLNENTEDVFKALCKSLMSNENNLNYFISNNYIDKISTFEHPILNLIYILVSKSSKSITSKAIFVISKMIASFPREILHIIAIYTEKVKENPLNENSDMDPWKIFEIAIQNFNLYLNLFEDENTSYSIGVDYVTLLGHIFEVSFENNILTDEKLENIWSTCCSMLSSYDKNVVIVSYSLLSIISDKISTNQNLTISTFPMEAVLQHLNQKKEFTRYAISFMLHFPPPKVNDQLFSNLICIASGMSNDDQSQEGETKKVKNISAKSKLILMQIANDENNCQSFLMNSKWMTMEGLPTFVDILTLFAILLSKNKYRDLFVEEINKETTDDNKTNILDNISTFFSNTLKKIPSDDILIVICTIIKRIPFSEKIMNKLSESGFFAEFFNRTLENNNIVNVQIGLIIVHYLSKVCYIKEFDLILEKLVQLVGNVEKVSVMSGLACIELCKYQSCIESLKKLNFANVLSQNPSNREFQQILKKFKKKLKGTSNS